MYMIRSAPLKNKQNIMKLIINGVLHYVKDLGFGAIFKGIFRDNTLREKD